MRFYVPEIGDRITLVSDWTFTLYNEHRNSDVWRSLDSDSSPEMAALRKTKAELEAEWDRGQVEWYHKVAKPYAHSTLSYWTSEIKPECQAAFDDWRERRIAHNANDNVPLTLPAGTVLTVDRIYIRKGQGDYSSLTFYIAETSHPTLTRDKTAKGFKKGRKRFWAKLHDVNAIDFEPVKEPETA